MQCKTVIVLLGVLLWVAPISDVSAASYAIHISSYQQEEKAIADQEALRKMELPAITKMVHLDHKGIWFRVLIGPYTDYDSAVHTAAVLTREKVTDYAKVIPYCGFQFLSKDKRAYVAQCVGGPYDGSVFKIKRGIINIFYAVPEISPINQDAEGDTLQAVGDQACACQ